MSIALKQVIGLTFESLTYRPVAISPGQDSIHCLNQNLTCFTTNDLFENLSHVRLIGKFFQSFLILSFFCHIL